MKYTVYILLNRDKSKTYVGYTNNLTNRLKEHNAGESSYTRRFGPWQIIHNELFESKNDAIKREKYFKSSAGRKWIKKNLFDG